MPGLRASRLAVAALACGLCACQDPLPPPPAQPIAFSHRIHAGDAKIGCTSCHAYAARGPVAGVPSMGRCRGCHKFVKEDPKDPRVTAEIKVVLDLLQRDQVVSWVRVHRLPDHVFFTHERHVAAGLRCQECHGEVEKMEVVRQVAPLTMGWCLDCHRRKIAEAPRGRGHLTDCWTCHK
ncbi:MAG TPA: cytochrome c3 family protein [Anaeromyxobacteraceae bacterium]|nr:cytochrome c3 family protein [Anaeromyxobacteraceae bacterium]